MVLKKGKFGFNRGSTLCRRCRHSNSKETGLIYKFVFGTKLDEQHYEEVDRKLDQYFQDGELDYSRQFAHEKVAYSINKHQRWTIPRNVKRVIDSEEIRDADVRLVMHERSRVPCRYAFFTNETKASSLSYHDSHYSTRHSYPNGKRKVSSLTDLKLKCHVKHEIGTMRSAATDGGYTTTTASIQPPRHNIYRWRPQEHHYRQIMEGHYHHVNIPEVRYEIHYPDVFKRYCKCSKYRGHQHMFPSAEKKILKQWKCKGQRNKPWAQDHYKGIDHHTQRLYANGYRDEEDVTLSACATSGGVDKFQYDADIAASTAGGGNDYDKDGSEVLYVQNVRRSITLADFCKKYRKHERHHHANKLPRSPNTALRGQSCKYYGKGNTIYINTSEEEDTQNQNTMSVENNNDDDESTSSVGKDTDNDRRTSATPAPVWADIDFEHSFCRCVIDKESIQTMVITPNSHDILISRCYPRQFSLAITGDAYESRLILWQKSGWSECSLEEEYWVKLQGEPGALDEEKLHDIFRSEVAAESGQVVTMQHLTVMARSVLDRTTTQRCQDNAPSSIFCRGYLTAYMSGVSYDVMTVPEASKTLVTTRDKDDISRTEELMSMSRSVADSSTVCDTCLCEFDDPLLNGCMLLPCQHYFCLDCWRRHIFTKIRDGVNVIPCQAYRCQEFVDDVMTCCLMSPGLANQWIYRKMERLVERSEPWQWCPDRYCSKVAKVINKRDIMTGATCEAGDAHSSGTPDLAFGFCEDGRLSSDHVPVVCTCRTVWCFSCKSDGHWPTTCEQNSTYRKLLQQKGDEGGGAYRAACYTYYVDVKKCPRCKHPIDKNGGCQVMTCRCSHTFCWECLQDWSCHAGMVCQTSGVGMFTMELSTTHTYTLPMRFYNKSVAHRYKWKKVFSVERIQRRLRNYAHSSQFKARKQLRDKKNTVPSGDMVDQWAHDMLQSNLVFLREVHVVMENMYVMLSHTTRRMGSRVYVSLLERLQFCVVMMEKILDQPRLCRDDIRRTGLLRTIMDDILRLLLGHSQIIQRQIQSTKQSDVARPTTLISYGQ